MSTSDAGQGRDVEVGDLAPDFRLVADDGREVRLGEYRGKTAIVLYFVRAFE